MSLNPSTDSSKTENSLDQARHGASEINMDDVIKSLANPEIEVENLEKHRSPSKSLIEEQK